MPDYLFVVVVIAAALLAACLAAAIVGLVGEARIARALRLPWTDER